MRFFWSMEHGPFALLSDGAWSMDRSLCSLMEYGVWTILIPSA